ncbi:MAG TPA: hypothetical protein VMU29_14945 [Smithella sp.]|nr:hypothetical protein [Smithella sp.]
MKTGIELITKERLRQIKKEKWSSKHDDKHKKQELARAAVAYALPPELRQLMKNGRPTIFPWSVKWWKLRLIINFKTHTLQEDRINSLVKAGALIAAEIDRIIRLESHGQ